MIKTTAIDLVNKPPFSVVWDTGRRCNYDCSYCESTRHNNFSPHRSLEELTKTYDFIKQYSAIYNEYRTDPLVTNINFTGGEPTNNPNFWGLLDYIKSQPEESHLGMNTNGAWGQKYTKDIVKYLDWTTVSYHAEAADSLKEKVVDNILLLHNSEGIHLNVNLMLHVDYWDECVRVYEKLKSNNVDVRLRPIGDGTITIKGWFQDADGSMRRTNQEYSKEQQDWFFEQSGISAQGVEGAQGTEMGRACCGGLCLKGKVDDTWQPIKLIDTHFKDWSCAINWFFLYIDQETGDVSHHQTCKALFDKQRGSFGNLSDTEQIFKFVRDNIDKTIICPNQRCGCGMCVPKAKDPQEFAVIQQSFTRKC